MGIVTEVKLVQLAKVYSPMLVIPLLIDAVVKLVQLAKTISPRLVTLFGILIALKLEQPLKAA